MGGVQSSCLRIANIVTPNDPVLNIRITGLEGSGKKSIINYIKNGKTALFDPSEEEAEPKWIQYGKFKIMLWTSDVDLAKIMDPENEGDESHSKAIIFVIDGTDRANFSQAKLELQREIERSSLKPELLVLINKCDDPTCVGVSEMSEILELDRIIDRYVHIQHTSAMSGEGIKDSLDWLCRRFEIKNGQYINRKETL